MNVNIKIKKRTSSRINTKNFVKNTFALMLPLLIIACETNHSNKDDPNENFNRQSLQFNLEVDQNLLRPTSKAYESITNDSVRGALGRFMNNLKEPYYAVNYLVSGNLEGAFNAFFRFVVNTLTGGLGIVDVGSHIGLNRADTSYKDTLASLEIETGDYLMLPIFGPSSTRDATGEVVSWFCDPVGYFISFPWMIGKAVLSAVHDRCENSEEMDNITQSKNAYVMLRSIYKQKYQKSKEDQMEEEIESEIEPEMEADTENSEETDEDTTATEEKETE